MPNDHFSRGRRDGLPSDGQLLLAWLVRAVLGAAIFGVASAVGRGEEMTLGNIAGYGLLFGVLVATLHFLMSLYARSRARRSPRD